MSDTTPNQPRTLWVNQNGRVVCIAHGGRYLHYAVAGGNLGPNIYTPLDHLVETVESEDTLCEECREPGSRAWVAAQSFVLPTLEEPETRDKL